MSNSVNQVSATISTILRVQPNNINLKRENRIIFWTKNNAKKIMAFILAI
ncbi:hypothetical protein HanIR_Chr04g0164911 [Helianthus annuus]|nr:hypothetical protein HanIR_Chr04g0164911 [Helianthus annuus]